MRRLIQRYLHDILIGIEAIQTNKIKSLLTALGIIFGVAAVISMLAIGNGAEHEILEQIKMVGVNNIIISPSTTTVEGSASDSPAASDETASGKKKFSRGLTLLDAEAIGEVVPTVARVCPVISINYSAILNGRSKPVTLEGTNNHYFDLFNISLQSGQVFNERQQEKGYPVCIIGDNIRNLFFGQEEPVGQYIKAGEVWLQVIGVVERRDFTASASDEMGISSTDNKIFIPVKTMLLRFKNRALVRADEIERQNNAGAADNENLNQLDKIIVQVRETEQLTVTSQILSRLILRRHNNLYDFEVTIPELLLKQQQRTKNIFNIVLGVIAGISLIVGGIGIMNIMLSSVMERIREIGLRQAIGASRKDIIVQFLAESTLISVVGGIAGIILGVALSMIITAVFDIKTIVSLFSIVIAFGVSALVGITFGYLPARRASDQDPVESLRQ